MRRASRRALRGAVTICTAVVLAAGPALVPLPGLAPSAWATPPSAPQFDLPPDDYATKDPVTACDRREPLNKPGVVSFMDRVVEAYPDTRLPILGIHNGCAGEVGEHWAGRAWDWAANANDPGKRASAYELLDWLFATRDGYAHAYARRFGIMYIIYDRKIWSAYPEDGAGRFEARTYTGSSPHLDHVHFSFSVKGSAKQTTWWTGRGPGNRLDVFARGGQNQLVHKWYRDGRWTESWEHLGTGLESGPEVASWAERRLDVFARAPAAFNNVLMHKWFADNRWQPSTGWEFITVGGPIHSDPTAVSWSRRRIDVFAKGNADQLVHTWFDDGTWRHEDLGHLGVQLDSAPDVASWAPGRLDVFAKGKERQLLHWWFDDNGWRFEQRGGPIDSAPTAVSWGPERIDVFAAGYPNRDLVHRWYQRGSDWQPATQWESLGGTLVGGPDAASWGFGRLDVFVRGTDSDLRHKSFVRGFGWSRDFESLGGVLASDPTAVSWTT